MKKTISILVVATLIASVAACSGSLAPKGMAGKYKTEDHEDANVKLGWYNDKNSPPRRVNVTGNIKYSSITYELAADNTFKYSITIRVSGATEANLKNITSWNSKPGTETYHGEYVVDAKRNSITFIATSTERGASAIGGVGVVAYNGKSFAIYDKTYKKQ